MQLNCGGRGQEEEGEGTPANNEKAAEKIATARERSGGIRMTEETMERIKRMSDGEAR